LEVQLQNALAAQRELWSKNHVLQEKLSSAEETISTNEALLPERISNALSAATAQLHGKLLSKISPRIEMTGGSLQRSTVRS
jgi:hypothetical protein